MTSLLEANGLALSGRLKPTSLTVEAGQMVGIIGPNGGGKTSLLRALADVESDAGTVSIRGEDLAAAPPARRARLLSFLPASREVIWPIRARDVIALASPSLDDRRINETVDMLELGAFADRPIDSLSTGERARVLLARALAGRPHLLLLDEPLSNLDPYWALRILEIIRESVDPDRRAAIVALHDLNQAQAFDRILLVNDGSIVADGTPSEVLDGQALVDAFAVEKIAGRWRIRRADPQSSQ
ncbi:MAG TPA: ABC transporter ATP-binding protein [Sphingomicrobium sp.]|jgi:iron complex transport system ATP-binding protein